MDYKKILEGVVDIINTTETSEIGFVNICSYIGENCPELAESGDEKNKRILRSISSKMSLHLHDIFTEEEFQCFDAWLEKQGNINPTEDELEALRMAAYEPTKNWSEKLQSLYEKLAHREQGEQKFKVGDTMRTLQEAANGVTDGMPVVVSIDDEYYHCNNEKIAIKDQDDYEYPPMNRRQNPVGWSEEDRKMMRNIIDDIHCGTNFNSKVMHAANEREKWFKSICMRYQSKWKPSEEQIRVVARLRHCLLEDVRGNDVVILDNLLEQLKAL